jgi:hypothetical protein
LLDEHANYSHGLKDDTDEGNVWASFCNNSTYQRFRTESYLQLAGVKFEYDFQGERTYQLGAMTCESLPHLPPCLILGTRLEYEDYCEAFNVAQGTGWVTHLAQQLQRIHLNMVEYMLAPTTDHTHVQRMFDDLHYWYQYHTREEIIIKWYSLQFALVEQVQKQTIDLNTALHLMGEILLQFNQESQPFWFPEISLEEMGALRFLRAGIPNPYADLFFVNPLSNPDLPWTHGVAKRQVLRSTKTFRFVDDEVTIFSYSPEHVTVQEGGGAAVPATSPAARLTELLEASTSLPAPEGCFTEGQLLGETGKAGEAAPGAGPHGPAAGGKPDDIRA